MSEHLARLARWFVFLLATAAAACAPKGPVMTERDLPPEPARPEQPTPADLDAPSAADEQALASLIGAETADKKQKPATNRRHKNGAAPPAAGAEASTGNAGASAAGANATGAGAQERNVAEAPPAHQEAAAPAPAPRAPMPHQSSLSAASGAELETALAGGHSPRSRAALALVREGRQQLAENNAFLAEQRFEKALSVDASCGQAMLGLAEVRFAQEKWQQAAAMATKATLHLGQSPYFLARAHVTAARAFINGDRPEAALQQVHKAIEADPDNEEARLLKISLEAHLGGPAH